MCLRACALANPPVHDVEIEMDLHLLNDLFCRATELAFTEDVGAMGSDVLHCSALYCIYDTVHVGLLTNHPTVTYN